MFELKVQGYFSAAHNLEGYGGECERLHGHNWLVEVAVTGEPGEDGMVVDFKVLKDALKEALGVLDHRYLNEIEYFKARGTTTENIARYVFEVMSAAVPGGVDVLYASAWESQGSGATYHPDAPGRPEGKRT